ncbi:NAD(P)-dependent alcohol dehydrogenase [Williamsia muralis]|uniref:alcohol dehydrogenase (NADP(+)) n=2 Tax=Williamsia marianensis TaxID=85044 RepID=A0ABU4F0G5_WILMA|nr:NAD(P)-dependent alcohol dehydrogenase [Williamsia muralis]MDV7136364.1 NAD(P)-dependent alcohol dehydrogenase [Williamsia muralis]
MPTVNAYAAMSATEELVPTTINTREVGPHDVRIAVAYAGICHSDIHTARNEWGNTAYPVVPGHEIAGTVAEIGSEVTKYQVGDRVGVGCFVDSCRECEACVLGQEQYCRRGMVGTYNSTGRNGEPTTGGYAQEVVVDANYVLRIPDSLGLDVAAPLLCAGITTYSPLRHWGAGPGKRVAIIGLGGLGHMGVKIAAAMGAEVSVISQSLKKMEDGLRLGAQHYYATDDPATFKQLRGKFDLIINTVSVNFDINKYMGMLALNGTLVELGLPEKPISVRAMSLTANRRSLAGSMIGGIAETQEMLDFCAEHDLGSEIEVIPAQQINEAYERVIASDVRYRFVIDNSTL